MSQKILRVLPLAGWILLIGIVFGLMSQSGRVAAAPPLQEPELGEPAVFPTRPAPDSAVEAQAQIEASALVVDPTINYQGYLADSSGNPVNGSVTMTAALYDEMSGGTRAWGPETHSGVQVKDGLFAIVLGQNTPLNPANFGSQLYLELAVEGTPLPRQKLRTVPYAFTLVPGAFVQGDSANPVVTVINNGDGDGLYAYETSLNNDYGLGADRIYSEEGYASDADTYLWVSGNEAVESETDINLIYGADGTVEVDCFTTSAPVDVHIPISLPGVLYGHDVIVKELEVEYYTSNPSTFIGVTLLNKGTGAGSSETLINSPVTRDSIFPTTYSLNVAATSNYTLTESSGPLNFNARISCGDNAHSLYIGGIRLRLGHPRTDL